MDYHLTQTSEYLSQLLQHGYPFPVPGAWPPTMHQENAARQPPEITGRQPVQYEEPVHHVVKPPSSTSDPKLPAHSNPHVANNKPTIPIHEDEPDPKKLPELTWPWRWAYVSSNTTTDPSARVLVPVNQETKAIHPSFYRRYPSALARTVSVGQLQSVSVGESASPSPKLDPTKAVHSAPKKKKDSSIKPTRPINDKLGQSRRLKKSSNKQSSVLPDPIKRERWLTIKKPKILQEGLVQLSLESDEDEWEKVDVDEEWELVDDPGVECKADKQSKA